jgi:hypothetical protein
MEVVLDIQIVRFEEDQLAVYPDLIEYDSEGSALDPVAPDRALWERLESYIAYRWGVRQAAWTINGCGEWNPSLGPTSNLTADVWDSDTFTWSAITPDQSPLGGFIFNDNRTYRITGTLGTTDPVPPAVVEAYFRLRDYVAEATAETIPVGVASHSLKIGDGYSEEISRNPNYLARSMNYSGAGDLLRSYRRI